jgi:serine/threonine-protein kinase
VVSRTEVRNAHVSRTGEPTGEHADGQVLDGRYEVKKTTGAKAECRTCILAREIASGATVAIKVLSPKLSNEQSSVSGSAARRPGHAAGPPNVCKSSGMGEYRRRPDLPGDAVSRGRPAERPEIKGGPIPAGPGHVALIQMCRGLAHAHDLHIIHRDLKPENVMLVKDPEVAAVGCGHRDGLRLAKERRAEPEVAKLTATGIVLGTPSS